MAHPQERTPHRVQMTFEVIPPVIHFFKDPIRGRPFTIPQNYINVNEPERSIPPYAISVIQDWYLTHPPDVFLIPIWLNLQEFFFSEFDSYFTVTTVEQLRPDIISYKYYASVDYFWIILLANDILDPFNIPVNKILRIPNHAIVLNKWLVRPVERIRGTL